jgi:predicted double-glycine peptidase
MTRFLFTLLSSLLISEEELRFEAVYKQGYDTSCGIAAAASLLNTYWNTSASEADLYQGMVFAGVEAGGGRYTVSFAGIGAALGAYGVQSRAYAMDWEALNSTLQKGYAPIAVHYEKPLPHFALLLHIDARRGYAFVADPARGLGVVDQGVFTKNYSGNALLTASNGVPAKNSAYIQTVITAEERRLGRLSELAASRRFRGGR